MIRGLNFVVFGYCIELRCYCRNLRGKSMEMSIGYIISIVGIFILVLGLCMAKSRLAY